MEDALKLKFLKGSATPLFVVEVLVFQVIEGNCVRLGVLLLAKLNLLCLEMLIKAGCDFFFGLQLILSWIFAKSETSFWKS